MSAFPSSLSYFREENSFVGSCMSESSIQSCAESSSQRIWRSQSSPALGLSNSQQAFWEDLDTLARCIRATEKRERYARDLWKGLIDDKYIHSWVTGLALIYLIAKPDILLAKRILTSEQGNSQLHREQRFVAIRKGVERHCVSLLQELLRVSEEEVAPFVCEALVSAVRHRSSKTLDFLLEEYPLSVNHYAKVAIYETIVCGWSIGLEKLSYFVSILESKERGAALQLACFHGHIDMVRLILKEGSPVLPADLSLAVYKVCQRKCLDEELLLLLLEDPALISHHILVSLLERCARGAYKKLSNFLLQQETIFSDREIAEAKNLGLYH